MIFKLEGGVYPPPSSQEGRRAPPGGRGIPGRRAGGAGQGGSSAYGPAVGPRGRAPRGMAGFLKQLKSNAGAGLGAAIAGLG